MVKRFDGPSAYGPGDMDEDPDGDYVLHSDYAILYAALSQIERLTHEKGPHEVYRIACNAMFGLPTPKAAISEAKS